MASYVSPRTMLFCVISQHYFEILVSNIGYLKRILRDLIISYDTTLQYFNSIEQRYL